MYLEQLDIANSQILLDSLKILLKDGVEVQLGDSGDAKLRWTGSRFEIRDASNNVRFAFESGKSSVYDENGSERFGVASGSTFSNNTLRPQASESRDLGLSTFAWRLLYLGSALFMRGNNTGQSCINFGTSNTEGLSLTVMEQTVVIGSSAASHDLNIDIPSGAMPIGGQLLNATIITATTAVKVGLGTAADPDKYGLTPALTKNSKHGKLVAPTPLGSAEDVRIYACDTGGSAAGTLDSGSVRVRLYYWALSGLDNAA